MLAGAQAACGAQRTPDARAMHAQPALSSNACVIPVMLLQCIYSHLVTGLTNLLRLLEQVSGRTLRTPALRARTALRTP